VNLTRVLQPARWRLILVAALLALAGLITVASQPGPARRRAPRG